MHKLATLVEEKTGKIVVARLWIATTFWQRSVGLLGMPPLSTDEALWLEPCTGIHTFGMRLPLDVLFLDRHGLAIHVVSHLRPLRVCGPLWKARTVVELPAGAVARQHITIGMRYRKSAV